MLLSHSPWLSNDVLREVVKRDDLFSTSIMVEILTANPDMIRDKQFRNELIEEANFNLLEIEAIKSVEKVISDRTKLLIEIQRCVDNHYRKINSVLLHFLSENFPVVYEQLRYWLDRKGSMEGQLAIVDSYLGEGDSFNAEQALNNIDANQIPEVSQFNDLKNLQINLINNNRTLSDLNATEISTLENIANTGNGIATAQAQSILNLFYGYNYLPKAQLPEGLLNGRLREEKEITLSEINYLTVKPNPAQNWTAIEYKLPDEENLGEISIRDLTGKVVFQKELTQSIGVVTFVTENLPNGIYFNTLIVRGEPIETEKIIIQH